MSRCTSPSSSPLPCRVTYFPRPPGTFSAPAEPSPNSSGQRPVDLGVAGSAAPHSYDTHDNPGDDMLRHRRRYGAALSRPFPHPGRTLGRRWALNSVTLIAADDHRVGSYHKRRLSPLAEFMPVPECPAMAGTPQYTAGDETVVCRAFHRSSAMRCCFLPRAPGRAGRRSLHPQSQQRRLGWTSPGVSSRGTGAGPCHRVPPSPHPLRQHRDPHRHRADGDFAAPQTELGLAPGWWQKWTPSPTSRITPATETSSAGAAPCLRSCWPPVI